jgi:GGDEF domain-containing protein
MIDKAIHEKFGEKSVWWGAAFPYFLILLTGDEAQNAGGVAQSIRTSVESMTFDERFNVTMHFGATEASCSWATAGGFRGLLNAVDRAIELGKLKVVANRVYGPARTWTRTKRR